MSALEGAVEEYLSMRRSFGFKLAADGPMLADFVAYLGAVGLDAITTEAAVEWATRPAGASQSSHARRLGVVRRFAEYMHVLDPRCEVPPADLLQDRYRRVPPYLYSEADIAGLLGAARQLAPPLRGATYETLIGLIAVTGMRGGETLRLDRADVDLGAGKLAIIDSKFNKSRELALHPSTVEALRRYACCRDELCPTATTSSFFISTSGTRLTGERLDVTFRTLVSKVGLEPEPTSGRRRPRVHDLRHSFATSSLIAWYRAGVDVQERLPLLSAYLGHVGPSTTYWYLSAAPELLTLAAQRAQAAQKETR
jgi:integrase